MGESWRDINVLVKDYSEGCSESIGMPLGGVTWCAGAGEGVKLHSNTHVETKKGNKNCSGENKIHLLTERKQMRGEDREVHQWLCICNERQRERERDLGNGILI